MRTHKPNKKSIGLYLVLLSVVVIAMIGLRRCGHAEGQQQEPPRQGNSQGDTIDIALLYAPMSYYMYNDTLGGYCYDALRLAAKSANTPIRLWPIVNLDEALEKLNSGAFDIVAPLPIDNTLRNQYDYTNPIYLDRQVLIQLRDSAGNKNITSSLDLARDTIHLAQSSPVLYRLHNLMQEIGDTIYTIGHDDLSDEYLFLKVAQGKIRYAVVADRIARQLHDKYPQVDYSTPISFTQFQGAVVRLNDTQTKQKFDAMMQEFENTDAATRLKQRYGLLAPR